MSTQMSADSRWMEVELTRAQPHSMEVHTHKLVKMYLSASECHAGDCTCQWPQAQGVSSGGYHARAHGRDWSQNCVGALSFTISAGPALDACLYAKRQGNTCNEVITEHTPSQKRAWWTGHIPRDGVRGECVGVPAGWHTQDDDMCTNKWNFRGCTELNQPTSLGVDQVVQHNRRQTSGDHLDHRVGANVPCTSRDEDWFASEERGHGGEVVQVGCGGGTCSSWSATFSKMRLSVATHSWLLFLAY